MTMPTLPETLGWIAVGAALSGAYLYLIGRTVAAVAGIRGLFGGRRLPGPARGPCGGRVRHWPP